MSSTSIIEAAPTQGLFSLTFNNSRKSGMRGVQTQHCQGVLYASGHVHLDTQALRITHFSSLSQMCDYLEEWGQFQVNWEQET